MVTLRSTLMAAALAATPIAAFAHHVGEIWKAGPLLVSHGWTVETGEMAHGIEVFLTVENTGNTADKLTAVSTDFSQDGTFQASVVDDQGTLVVKEVSAIQIAPGQVLTFQPGGVHIVLQDVKRALEGGEHFDMTLTFAEAGTLEIEVEIEHGDDDHDDGDHDDNVKKPSS